MPFHRAVGGNCQKIAAILWSAVRRALVREPSSLTSLYSLAYFSLVNALGPDVGNWSGLGHEERPQVANPAIGIRPGRRDRSPLPGARSDHRGERGHEAITCASAEHGCRGGCAGTDALVLGRAVRDLGQACRVGRVERGHLVRRDDRHEHVMGCGGDRGLDGCRRVDAEGRDVEQVWLAGPIDGVDGVVDGALDHRDPANLAVRRGTQRDGVLLRGEVPGPEHVRAGRRHRRGRWCWGRRDGCPRDDRSGHDGSRADPPDDA